METDLCSTRGDNMIKIRLLLKTPLIVLQYIDRGGGVVGGGERERETVIRTHDLLMCSHMRFRLRHKGRQYIVQILIY